MAHKVIKLVKLEAATGMKLSAPSKMPGFSFALPALACKVGSQLRKVKGSVCEGCYAMKGRYAMPNVADVRWANLDKLPTSIETARDWALDMVGLIKASGTRYFRWHDSGDLQSAAHLAGIAMVAEFMPTVSFWLPTKEKALIQAHLREYGAFAGNLNVRLSGAMIDGPAPTGHGFTTSTVHSAAAPTGHQCPAPQQGGNCGECRACWNPDVANVSYHVH